MATPAEIAKKWSRRMSAAAPDMAIGANSLDTSPGVLAAENINGYIAGVQSAIASGKTERAMRSVTLEDWRSRYIGKGIPNATAAATNQTVLRNVESYQSEAAPVYQSIRAKNRQMKRDGVSGRERALAAIDAMEAFGKTRSSR